MGAYINPGDDWSPGTKESWLEAHATPLVGTPQWGAQPDGWLPVCWINTGSFTAAIVAYDERELDRVVNGVDGRVHRWYYAKLEDLAAVSPVKAYLETWA